MFKGVNSIITVIVLLFINVIFVTSSYALLQSNYSFKQVSFEQGLPGTNLRDQIQDRDGIMWLALESIGLCRYDGHKFTLFKNDPLNPQSISSNYVNRIREDSAGYLWIATDHGLNQFNKRSNTFKTYLHIPQSDSTLPDNIIHSLYVDSKNRLWVGTANGLAVKDSNSDTFKSYFSGKSSITPEKLSVICITESTDGVLWLGTNKGLVKFNAQTEQHVIWNKSGLSTNKPSHDLILSVLPYKNKMLWVATQNGIDRFNLTSHRFEKWKFNEKDDTDLKDEGFNSLMLDKHEKLWAGTFTKGLVVIDPNTNEYKRIYKEQLHDNSIRSNHIRYIYEDRSGLIWIGTKFEGIFKYNDNINVLNNWPDRFNCLTPLNRIYLLSFLDDEKGNYWLGTKHDGLYQVTCSTGEIINYKHDGNYTRTINSNRINHIFQDSNDNLWVGTERGLNKRTGNNHFVSYSSEHTVFWIHEDQTGTVWIATSNGIYIIDHLHQNLKRFHSAQNDSFFRNTQYEIVKIYSDQQGTVWFSTRYNGLHSYSPANDTYACYVYNENSEIGIGDNMPRALLEDSEGRFWVGTKSQGLSLLDRETGKYRKITMEDGLPSNMVLSVQEDTQGNLWLGTHTGITKFDTENNSFTNYNSDFGLLSNVSEIAACHSFETGELLFGGNNGFNIFNPMELIESDYIDPLIITSIKINDVEIANDINTPIQIKLNHKQTFISFEYTLTNYNNPNRHQYMVMFEEVDENWKNTDNRNYVSYNNLNLGNYIFHLRGANEFGNWSATGLSVEVEVLKPIYKQLWFKLTGFIFIILLFVFIVIQIRRRQKILKLMINERTRKLQIAYKELLNKNTKIREQNRQIELHHQELEQKVTERTRDLEIAKRKAEESDRLKSSFLANMSHEIRTPLNAITGFSTLVSSDMYNSVKKQTYVNIIKSNVGSLLKLVEDILDISKIESGQMSIEKEFFDFSSLFSEVNTIIKNEIKYKHDKKVHLKCIDSASKDRIIEFYSDKLRIKQILINLLSNAVKFTKIGEIELGFKLEEDTIKIWVRDTGIGIKAEDIDSIFNRFTKIEENNAIYRGTGLGLSISKSLVNMLGGKIWVESEVNVGSCFYVELPGEIRLVQNWNTGIKKEKLNKTQLNMDLREKSILIIEPERSNYMLLHSYLLSTQAKIVWAHDGKSAIRICKKESIDLIILDIRIPDVDGYELFTLIKELLPDVLIIAQTAYATSEEKKKLADAGFNDFIIKPYLKDELYRKIMQFI